MTTSWVEILRNASLGAFQGPNGDYPSVLEAIDGLTAIKAAWKPSPDRHSIWQIVDHLTKSKEWERRVIIGERPPSPTWDDPTGDEDAWRATIERLRTAQTQLLAAIDHLVEEDLWKRPPTKRGWPVVNFILNKAAHDAYHAGQIRHLRALLGTLNDEMVTRLVKQGAIPAGRIEAAFHTVAREHFLPGVPLESVYSGEAVITRRDHDGGPISSSSMPEIMAIMLRQLDVQAGHRVLEIGAGTGYNAAVLASMTGSDGSVTTIDIDEVIVREARERLDAAGFGAVRTITGDGWLGAEEHGPYDRIEATVGVPDLSPAWAAQLKGDGRIVVPLWLTRGYQLSVAFRKDAGRLRSVALTFCGFMRLRGPHAGPETFLNLKDWCIPLDEPDPVREEALKELLELEPRSEPAPIGPRGWPTRLLLEEPDAIQLWREGKVLKNAWGVLVLSPSPGLAFITSRTWDHQLYSFGNDAARELLCDRVAKLRGIELRDLTIDALPSVAPSPPDAMVLRRPNFQFVIRERNL